MKKNFATKLMLVKVIRSAIERLDTIEAADSLEYEIQRARSGGILDDRTAIEMLHNIAAVRKELIGDEN